MTPDDPDDIALIDAVVPHDDVMGSFMPFEGKQLGTLILTRAEPGSVGHVTHWRDISALACTRMTGGDRVLRSIRR